LLSFHERVEFRLLFRGRLEVHGDAADLCAGRKASNIVSR
jgi:hypothetical protein